MKNQPNTRDSSAELPDDVLSYLYSSPIFLLRRTDQRAAVIFNRAAKHLKLTLPQSHILFIASEVGSFPQVELARQVATNEASASAAIAYLVERDLVQKVSDPSDGRRNVIQATDEGRALIDAVKPIQRASLAELEAPLGDRAAAFRDLLAELVTKAGGEIPYPEGLPDHSIAMLEMVRGSTHFLVRRAIQLIEAAATPHHATGMVTLRQYVVLLAVALMPGAGESRIASTIGLDLSNASFIVRGLRTKKLVEVDQTARRRRYTATASGYELIAKVEPLIASAVSLVLGGIAADKRSGLLSMIGDLIASGSTVGVPPAFDRIRNRPDWPMIQRPNQFNHLLQARQGPLAVDLVALLQEAASIAQRSSDASLGLTLRERSALEEKLRKIITLKEFSVPRSGSEQVNNQ